ncbi:MAG TPA: hypothetical protein VIB38_09905 [Aestuariivirgaceae bacterium]|jgi:hypothetical protein
MAPNDTTADQRTALAERRRLRRRLSPDLAEVLQILDRFEFHDSFADDLGSMTAR